MDLKQLRELGGIVSSTPVKKEVTWNRTAADGSADPVTVAVHIKKLSFGSIERLFAVDEKDAERSRMASFIADTVLLGEDGQERITYEDAYQLDAGLARVLMDAISAVNGTSAGTAPKD